MTIEEILSKKKMFASRKVGNELLLVPIKNSIADMTEMFTLNGMATYIWEKIDVGVTEESIINKIMEDYDIDEETARKDLKEFLVHLSELNIATNNL